ncbi:MAG: PDZ domain-containing protein [Deltaproteobacteria bacterium]|nr:PDZ domain-containing protein [Deltaproteobacteria bacterium]
MKRALLLLAALALLIPAAADAKPKKKRGKGQTATEFYDAARLTLATVNFSQEFVAGGSPQQTTSATDGVVISPDGLVLISGTVRFPQSGPGRLRGGSLPELSSFRLHFSDGRQHEAEVVTFDTDLNLGLLRITDGDPEKPFEHVSFGDDFEPAIGSGLRSMTLYTQEYGREPVYSPVSINSLLSTPQDVWSLSGAGLNMLGAPLWSGAGKVVGVVAQVPMSPGGGRQVMPQLSGPVGLSYGRFAEWLSGAVEQAQAVAEVVEEEPEEAGWLGIEFQALERPLAKHLGISEGGGIFVTRVIPGSPAAKGGLEPLDILVTFDGERIAVNQNSDLNKFIEKVRAGKPGAVVRFGKESRGDGAVEEVAITLMNSPKTELQADRREDDRFDITVREITMDALLGQRLDPETAGVIVDGVTRAGWAGLAGLSRGMIIQRINEHDVTDLDSFSEGVDKVLEERPDKVLFFVRFRRDTRFFVAEPDWTELDEP